MNIHFVYASLVGVVKGAFFAYIWDPPCSCDGGCGREDTRELLRPEFWQWFKSW
jgi:hypothetical protein